MVALGTIDDPLTISDALDYWWIKPGHTVYLRGGVYDAQSSLTCTLQGTAEAPITVRNYPGEVAQIDAKLVLSCPYTRWLSEDYGLEVIGTSTNRVSDEPGGVIPDGGHDGIFIEADGIELINVRILNSVMSGILWMGSWPGLVYGCHIIHNGSIGPDRVHGPGIYTHNNAGGAKRIENVVVVDSFRYGLQVHSETTNHIWNYDIVDTTIVGPNVIISGKAAEYPVIDDVLVDRLMLYESYPLLGHYTVERNAALAFQNSVVKHSISFVAKKFDALTITNCRFSADNYTLEECEPTITDCTFGNLSGVDVNLVPNTYAPNFATLTVFDWDASGTVNIDVSAFVASGTVRVHNIILMRSEYRDVEVVAGVLALDMTGWTTPPPLGLEEILTDAYPGDFGVWILEKLDV